MLLVVIQTAKPDVANRDGRLTGNTSESLVNGFSCLSRLIRCPLPDGHKMPRGGNSCGFKTSLKIVPSVGQEVEEHRSQADVDS